MGDAWKRVAAAAVVVLGAAAGCATTRVSTLTSGTETPMRGVVAGVPFPVRSAWVRPVADQPGLWELHITDHDNRCGVVDDRSPRLWHHFVTTTRWERGATRDLGDGARAGFTTWEGGHFGYVPVTEGRLEVLDAPAENHANGEGKVRLVARDADGSVLQGVVDVTTCAL